MKKYIQPTTEIIPTSIELMLELSDDVGSDDEFADYGNFDEELELPKINKKLWED